MGVSFMKTLRIKYIPPMIMAITVVLFFGLWLLPMCLSYNEKMTDYALVGSLAGMAVGVVLLVAVSSTKTLVKLGEDGVIRCIWLFYSWEIDLAKTESFSCCVQPHRARGGTVYSLDLVFISNKDGYEDESSLKVNVGAPELRKLLKGEADDIDIMKIYKYAEALYPDKAKGLDVGEESIF